MSQSTSHGANPQAAKKDNQLILLTSLSGAGKSTALAVLEDLQYFTVDGLPASLTPEVASIINRVPNGHFSGMAIGLDLRQPDFLSDFNDSLAKLRSVNPQLKIIFLEADTQTLIRRYSTTRRPHPLERTGLGLEGAIAAERKMLEPIREQADLLIDSSDFSIHDLRREIQRNILNAPDQSRHMRVNLVSFGFKYGLPEDADFIFDLRFLANPYFVKELKPLSGKDTEVAEYIFKYGEAREFRHKILDLLKFTLEQMGREGRYRVTIAFGCTGGRHRSVAMTEALGKELKKIGFRVHLEHRHINQDTRSIRDHTA